MKQVMQSRSDFATVRDVPPPACPPGGILVRNAFSAISSGTERARVELSNKSLVGKARERPDLVREVINRARREGWRKTREALKQKLDEETAVGYSSAGEIVEVGEHVRGLRVGDRVACAGGGYANHAEIVAIPSNLCAKVPSEVSLDVASLVTIAAIALNGVRLAKVTLGDRVAVVGCGLVGQITVRLLRAAGATPVAVDVDPTRVEDARRGGAIEAFGVDAETAQRVRAATAGVGADAVIVTAASTKNDPLVLAAECARDRGTVVLVGAVPIEFPRAPLYDRELTFRVSRSYGPGRYDLEYEERGLDYPIGYVRWTEQRNMEAVLTLAAQGQLFLDDLIEDVVPVAHAADAYRRLVDSTRPLTGALLISYAPGDDTIADTRAVTVETTTVTPGVPVRPTAGEPRLGLVGPGRFARRMILPAFLAAGARPEMVGGGSGPSAEAAYRNYGFRRLAGSSEALIHDDEIDIVAICTRHGSHAQLAAQALRAGRHVFVEKPLALTSEELEDVLDAAQNAGRVLAVGFNRRFAPMVQRARSHLSAAPGAVVVNFRVSAGYLPPTHWTHDLVQGGGRILGEGCHFIDTLAYLVGSPIVEVYTRGYSRDRLPLQAADDATITLGFADGSLGTVNYVADGAAKVPKERLEAFRGKRTVILDDYRNLELYVGSQMTQERASTLDKGHYAEVAAFVGAVRAGAQPVPLSEVANVSFATLATIESLRTGMPVRLPLRRESPSLPSA